MASSSSRSSWSCTGGGGGGRLKPREAGRRWYGMGARLSGRSQGHIVGLFEPKDDVRSLKRRARSAPRPWSTRRPRCGRQCMRTGHPRRRREKVAREIERAPLNWSPLSSAAPRGTTSASCRRLENLTLTPHFVDPAFSVTKLTTDLAPNKGPEY